MSCPLSSSCVLPLLTALGACHFNNSWRPHVYAKLRHSSAALVCGAQVRSVLAELVDTSGVTGVNLFHLLGLKLGTGDRASVGRTRFQRGLLALALTRKATLGDAAGAALMTTVSVGGLVAALPRAAASAFGDELSALLAQAGIPASSAAPSLASVLIDPKHAKTTGLPRLVWPTPEAAAIAAGSAGAPRATTADPSSEAKSPDEPAKSAALSLSFAGSLAAASPSAASPAAASPVKADDFDTAAMEAIVRAIVEKHNSANLPKVPKFIET